MPYNGNGVFQRLYSWVNDAAAGIKIRADRMDNEMNGFATALSSVITKDGQTTITANLPMASKRHTNVGDATVRDEYSSLGQTQDGTVNWVVAGGTSDAITAGYTVPISTIGNGQIAYVRASNANATATPTFSPNGITARTITKNGNQPLLVGDIYGSGHELILRANNTTNQWELLNPAVSGVPLLASNNTFTGINTFNASINETRGAAIASAATTDIGAATGNFVHISGTTTITALGTIQAGVRRVLIFDGILTLTHNATSLILPKGANIVTMAGDSATFISEGSGNWRCVDYQRADGLAISAIPYLHIVDEKASGVSGGTSIAGNNPRTLNTVKTNTITGASLAANVITLPVGTYDIKASAPSAFCQNHALYLVNNATSAIIETGTSEYTTNNSTAAQTRSFLTCRLVVTGSPITLNLTHYMLSGSTDGLGRPVGAGLIGKFSEIEITKVG